MPGQPTIYYQTINTASPEIISQGQEAAFSMSNTNMGNALGELAQVTNLMSAFMQQQIEVMANVTIQLQVLSCNDAGTDNDSGSDDNWLKNLRKFFDDMDNVFNIGKDMFDIGAIIYGALKKMLPEEMEAFEAIVVETLEILGDVAVAIIASDVVITACTVILITAGAVALGWGLYELYKNYNSAPDQNQPNNDNNGFFNQNQNPENNTEGINPDYLKKYNRIPLDGEKENPLMNVMPNSYLKDNSDQNSVEFIPISNFSIPQNNFLQTPGFSTNPQNNGDNSYVKNTYIQTLVGQFTINTTNLQEDLTQVKQKIVEALQDAVGDTYSNSRTA